MSPADARASLVHAECTRDWQAVRTHLDRARSVDPAVGDAQAGLVALSLDHAYQAFETILLRLTTCWRSTSTYHVARTAIDAPTP